MCFRVAVPAAPVIIQPHVSERMYSAFVATAAPEA